MVKINQRKYCKCEELRPCQTWLTGLRVGVSVSGCTCSLRGAALEGEAHVGVGVLGVVQPRVLVEQEQLTLARGGPDLARPHPRLQPEVLRPAPALLLQAVQVGLVQGGHAAARPLGLPLGAARRRHDEPVLGTPRLDTRSLSISCWSRHQDCPGC